MRCLRRATLWLPLLLFAAGAANAYANPFDHQDPQNPERAVRMWLPPGIPHIRGIIIWGNPGTGDARPSVFNPALRAWASNIGFGLLCTKAVGFDTASMVLEALHAFASATSHPELADVPFVALGHSNGGLVALGLAKAAPARTIAFAMNKAAVFVKDVPPAAYGVPAIFVAGEFDLERRKGPMKALFAYHRARGALWAFVEEQGTGHGGKDSRAMDLIMPFLQSAIATRLIDNTNQLRRLDENQGWLASVGSSRRAPLAVVPFASYRRSPRAASWLLNEATARLFSTIATYDRPLRLTVTKAGEDRDDNAALVGAGDVVEVAVETFAADEHWQRLVWYDGADVLGETHAPPEAKANAAAKGAAPRFKASLRTGVHGLWVKGHRQDGRVFVAAPARIIVSGGSGTPFGAAAEPPAFILQPSDQAITEGEVAVFESRGKGGGDLRYQWLRNDEPIAGATHPTLRVTNQPVANSGDVFQVRLSNEAGTTQSLPAHLTVASFAGGEATYTASVPVIDGRKEGAWLAARSYPLAHLIAGSSSGASTKATWRALWDHQALYVMIEGHDDEVYGSSLEPWSNDTAEVFIEGSNSKSVRWGAFAYQFGLPVGSNELVEAFSGRVPDGVRGQRGNGAKPHEFLVEYRLAETALGVSLHEGVRVGFDVHVNDCDNAGRRRVKLAWHTRQNNSYESPQHLGILKLVAASRGAPAEGRAVLPIKR